MKLVKPLSIFLLSSTIALSGAPINDATPKEANAKTTVDVKNVANVTITNASLKKSTTYQNKQLGTVTLNNTTSLKKNMFKGSTIQKLIVNQKITGIGESAFENATVKELSMNNTASLGAIGKRSFYNASIGSDGRLDRNILSLYGTKSIADSAFEKAKLYGVDIFQDTTKIGANAFKNARINYLQDHATEKRSVGKEAFHNMEVLQGDIQIGHVANLQTEMYKNLNAGDVSIAFVNDAANNAKLPKGLFLNGKIQNFTASANVLSEIGERAFYQTTFKNTPIFNAKLIDNIMPRAFENAKLNEFKTNNNAFVKRIHEGAFIGATLQTLDIQMENGFISRDAFKNNQLVNVTLKGSIQEIENEAFVTRANQPIENFYVDALTVRNFGNESTSVKGVKQRSGAVVSNARRIIVKNFVDIGVNAFNMKRSDKDPAVEIILDNRDYGNQARLIKEKAFRMKNSKNVTVSLYGMINNVGPYAFENFTGSVYTKASFGSIHKGAFKNSRIRDIDTIIASTISGIDVDAFNNANVGPNVTVNANDIRSSAFYNNKIQTLNLKANGKVSIQAKAFQKNKITKINKSKNATYNVAKTSFDSGVKF